VLELQEVPLLLRDPFWVAGSPELREGQMVEFEMEPAKDGKTAATNLKLR
jgi:cold shock CspA family protein